MSDFKDETTASECVDYNMKTFADYTIATKFPNYLDGLKMIARRVIYTIHRMGPTTHKELSVGGEVVKMHPHGDSSINTAISVMAQPFSHIVPLTFSSSNIGTYDGDDPAGARYVDVAESDAARALFFQDTNMDMIRLVPCESEIGTEPTNMIPKLPTALLIPNFAIAVGYQSKTAICSVPDLCKLTKEYIRLRASVVDWLPKVKRTLVKYMLPDFPTACVLRNGRVLIEQYRKGNFDYPALIDGIMSMTKDRIIIHTLPPDKAFRKVTFGVGSTMAKSKGSWEAQNFQQMEGFADRKQGIMQGNFECTVRRGMNPFDVLATLKKKIQFSGNWKPDRNYTDYSGRLLRETPISLLDKWYSARYNEVLGDLKQTLSSLVDQQRRLLALIIVRDHAKEVFDIHNNAKDTEVVIPILVKRFELTRYQAKFVSTLTFGQITAKGKEDLQKELDEIKRKMEELNKQFHRIPEIMIEHIESFENRFVIKPYKQGSMTFDLSRRCIVPKYIGAAVYRGNGYILIEDEKEFDKVLRDFDPEDIDFKLFDTFGDIRAIGTDEDIGEDVDLPKYLRAGFVDRVAHFTHTACMFEKVGAMLIKGQVERQNNMKYAVPVGNEFTLITKQGYISHEKVTEKTLRKSVSAGPTMKDAIYVGPAGTDLIVIHGSSSQPNNLMIERVDVSKGPVKLRKIVVGEWKILNVVTPDTQRVYVNIPQVLRSRCSTRHLVIDNIGSLISTGQRLNCTFGRSTIKSDFDICVLRRKSTIMQAMRKTFEG